MDFLAWTGCRKLFRHFFLVCLSFLSLSVTAYSLSVYQLRARMQSYTVGKQPLSMYQLKRFADLTRVESNSVEVQEKLFLQKQMLMEKMSPLVLEITELGLSYRNEEVPVITALRVGGILPEVLPEVADGKDETFRNRLAALQGACTRADVCKDQKTLQNLAGIMHRA